MRSFEIRAVPELDRWSLWRESKEHVPAYSHFLGERGFLGFSPREDADWKSLPWMDKRNYVTKYPLLELLPKGHLAPVGHASSGSSGKPTFWIRGPKQKAIGVECYSIIIDRVIGIPSSERTLVLVCFSLGVWVAGIYTLLAFERIAEMPGRNISVMSPGMEIEDICLLLEDFAGSFENVVLIGYPAALDLLFGQIKERKVPLPKKLHLITSGDKISEPWRSAKMQDLGISNPSSIVNVYGSSDGGILAAETPLSIEIRRKLQSRPDLMKSVLGATTDSMPALFQFDPRLIFFEEAEGELVLTADLDLPLIRYNIHDTGKVIAHEEMLRQVAELGLRNTQGWEFPFVTVASRTDVAVSFYGVKIFPEQLRRALQDDRIAPQLSGSFLAYVDNLERGERFCLDLELSARCDSDVSALSEMIGEVLQEQLMKSSNEYRNSCLKLGKDANRPRIRLFAQSDRRFHELSKRAAGGGRSRPAFFWQVGKKPKVIALYD